MKLKLLFVALLLCMGIMGCEEDAPPRRGKSDAMFNPNLTYGSMTDIDGNVYKTITVGKQTWMAQNLRVTHYRNGDPINFDTDSLTDWNKIKVGTYCTPYATTDLDTIATYGLLYNGYAVIDSRNIAPKGWRVPTKEDIDQLYAYLRTLKTPEDPIRLGGRLKEVGTKHWTPPNIATNSTGLTLLPTTERYNIGFMPKYYITSLLTTQTKSGRHSWTYGATSFTDLGGIGKTPLVFGNAVRCIKEE